jgi:hypothetical protein
MAERGSDKINPRVDRELERETEALERGAPVPSRAEEFRQQEAPAEGEPAPDARPASAEGEGTWRENAEARTELGRHLQPSAFPADRTALLASAREMHAPDEVIAALEELPDGRTFQDVAEVWEALGGGR